MPKTTTTKKPGSSKPLGSKPKRNNPPSPSYKKIAVAFIACTIVLIMVIVYFSLSKAKIILVANEEKIAKNIQINIAEDIGEGETNYLKGYIVSQEFKETKEWPVEQGERQEAKAKGMVTVINTHSVSQTLVATTRLLTPANVLFRIQRTIIVPAGGKLQVLAEADKPGESGNIGPSKFTIPGLRENLRKKIYAESYEPMSGGVVMVGTLTQDQVDAASQKFLEEVYQSNMTKLEMPEEIKDKKLEKVVIKKIIDQRVDEKIGAQVGSFNLTIHTTVAHILFDKTEVLEMAKNELKKQIGHEQQLVNYELDNFNYFLRDYDWNRGVARLDVVLAAWVKSKVDLESIDKSEIKGMNTETLRIFFEPWTQIKEVKVRFWPFWVKTIPTLEDHIEIEVRE